MAYFQISQQKKCATYWEKNKYRQLSERIRTGEFGCIAYAIMHAMARTGSGEIKSFFWIQVVGKGSSPEKISHVRAKGYLIASLTVFLGVKELEGLDSKQELVKTEKDKVKEYVENVIEVDYVVGGALIYKVSKDFLCFVMCP
ncbi:hypothetical protein DVH24_018182 [Malus domestica]|uniref:Uncharacterized protein n=1 Tax=Malus domestica TaxID=3750 RepID=A0A498KCS3_MALDO|nr:hypothetical protein DVH24_018182 [Malus domestica]